MSIIRVRDSEGNVQEILTIRGEPGKDYVLTEADKVEIAGMISEGSGDSAAVTAHLSNTNNPHKVTAEQIGAVPAETFATYCEDTALLFEGYDNHIGESLEGISDFNDHKKDKNNPHGVTCEQIGAVTQAELEGAVATALNNASIAYVGSAAPANDMGKDGDIYIVSG